MRLLPPLVAGRSRWVLPMADGSAAAIVRRLLGGECSQTADSLSAILASDPPLLLWTVSVASERRDLEPRSLGEVAQWLAEHALEVLQWQSGGDSPFDVFDSSQSEVYGDCVAAALEVADLTCQLTAESAQPLAELAFLKGLLNEANQRLPAQAGETPAPQSPTMPHDGTGSDIDAAAEEVVEIARRIVAGEAPPPDCPTVNLAALRHRAAEGRQRWLASDDGLASILPALTARLARLVALEDRFQESLEREKLEALAEFAAGAGHEINNPLTVIAGRAQLFLSEEKDPERRRALALMNVQAKRVYEMIADMMLFARPPQPEFADVDLSQLVDRLIEEVSPRAALQDTLIRRAGAVTELPQIEADATQLMVALRALCQNALEALGRGGQIEIAVEKHGSNVAIHVADDGPGIAPEERRHLFDPFYSARQAGRGLGLGLSKCWRIVTNHHGRIDVASTPGHGAAFTITLPIKQ